MLQYKIMKWNIIQFEQIQLTKINHLGHINFISILSVRTCSHWGQNQSPSGTRERGGERQVMW